MLHTMSTRCGSGHPSCCGFSLDTTCYGSPIVVSHTSRLLSFHTLLITFWNWPPIAFANATNLPNFSVREHAQFGSKMVSQHLSVYKVMNPRQHCAVQVQSELKAATLIGAISRNGCLRLARGIWMKVHECIDFPSYMPHCNKALSKPLAKQLMQPSNQLVISGISP